MPRIDHDDTADPRQLRWAEQQRMKVFFKVQPVQDQVSLNHTRCKPKPELSPIPSGHMASQGELQQSACISDGHGQIGAPAHPGRGLDLMGTAPGRQWRPERQDGTGNGSRVRCRPRAGGRGCFLKTASKTCCRGRGYARSRIGTVQNRSGHLTCRGRGEHGRGGIRNPGDRAGGSLRGASGKGQCKEAKQRPRPMNRTALCAGSGGGLHPHVGDG